MDGEGDLMQYLPGNTLVLKRPEHLYATHDSGPEGAEPLEKGAIVTLLSSKFRVPIKNVGSATPLYEVFVITSEHKTSSRLGWIRLWHYELDNTFRSLFS